MADFASAAPHPDMSKNPTGTAGSAILAITKVIT
jgi:hypothetical protein